MQQHVSNYVVWEWENDRSPNASHRRPYPGSGGRAPNVFTSLSKMYPDLSGKLTCPDTATVSLLGHWAIPTSPQTCEAAEAEPAETPPSRQPCCQANPTNTNPTDGYIQFVLISLPARASVEQRPHCAKHVGIHPLTIRKSSCNNVCECIVFKYGSLLGLAVSVPF